MTITEIYEKYEIPPNLADHQLTVAGVASIICEVTKKGNADGVIAACLLHDMGNIIKFDLDKKLPGVEMNNVDHWKEVQKRFVEKYGNEEHIATMAIANEIKVSKEVIELIDAIGFRHSLDTLRSGNVSKMIAGYSDMRVAPHGVVPLEERLSDLAKRYGASADREQYNQAFRKIETTIFSNILVNADVITQKAIHEKKKQLEDFVL